MTHVGIAKEVVVPAILSSAFFPVVLVSKPCLGVDPCAYGSGGRGGGGHRFIDWRSFCGCGGLCGCRSVDAGNGRGEPDDACSHDANADPLVEDIHERDGLAEAKTCVVVIANGLAGEELVDLHLVVSWELVGWLGFLCPVNTPSAK